MPIDCTQIESLRCLLGRSTERMVTSAVAGKKRDELKRKREVERESSSLCPRSLEFLGDTGGRIGIINSDLLQWQRLRSADYLTVMSARYNYIYISYMMEYH